MLLSPFGSRAGLAAAGLTVLAACGGSTERAFTPSGEPDGSVSLLPGDHGDGGSDPGNLFGSDGGVKVDGDGGFQSCAKGLASASRKPVYLLFVLDGSGSMNHDNKWVAATQAIDAFFTDEQKKADPGVGAGLIVFSDSEDPNLNTGGPYPSSVDVPLAFVDQGQLGKLTARTALPDAPQSNTPTGRALTGGYGELASFNAAAPLAPGGKKVLVLITDGVPTDQLCKTTNHDGTDDYANNGCIRLAATQLAATSANGSVETFVIGVGPLPGDFATYDTYWLAALAVAGGSAPVGCNPHENASGATDFCYFNVDPSGSATATEQALAAAIDGIRGQVSSCTLAIDATGAGTIDPGQVNVVVNGTPILQDPTNGWTYDDPKDPTSVTLHGTSCDALKGNPNATVSIILGCITLTPK